MGFLISRLPLANSSAAKLYYFRHSSDQGVDIFLGVVRADTGADRAVREGVDGAVRCGGAVESRANGNCISCVQNVRNFRAVQFFYIKRKGAGTRTFVRRAVEDDSGKLAQSSRKAFYEILLMGSYGF